MTQRHKGTPQPTEGRKSPGQPPCVLIDGSEPFRGRSLGVLLALRPTLTIPELCELRQAILTL